MRDKNEGSAEGVRRDSRQFGEAGSQFVDTPPEEFTPRRKSRLLQWLVIVLIILLIVLGALFGWLWWRDRDAASDSGGQGMAAPAEAESMPTETAACGEGLNHYQNASLGLQFCYPEVWGTVTAADAKLDPSDTGTRQNLSFSDKNAVNVGVATTDWSTTFGRDGVCSDPATPDLPPFAPFSAAWNTFDDGSGVASVDRGIQKVDGQYLINEFASTTLAEVVCLTGYKVLDGTPFTHAAGSYAANFNVDIPSPSAHMADPNVLIALPERQAFYDFVQSIDNL